MQLLLFGSHARGSARSDSDIDVICTGATDAEERELLAELMPYLAATGGVVDLFIDHGCYLAAPPSYTRQIWLDGDGCHQDVMHDARETSLQEILHIIIGKTNSTAVLN